MPNLKKIDTGTDQLLCEISKQVGIITLNQPRKRNALGDILTPALRNILQVLENDTNVNVIIITGAGKAFCSGGDISTMGLSENKKKTKDEQISDLIKKQNDLTLRLFKLKKPTIAMIPGATAGAGLCIALACDLRIASYNAIFTTGFGNVGLPGDYGGTWFLPKVVGLDLAKRLFFTAEIIDSKKALEIGIITELTKENELKTFTFELAKKIASAPPNAIQAMKKNLNNSISFNLKQGLRAEAEDTIEAISGDEHRLAVKEFLNRKRK